MRAGFVLFIFFYGSRSQVVKCQLFSFKVRIAWKWCNLIVKLSFGTKKVVIWWFFDDDFRARGREPEKKETEKSSRGAMGKCTVGDLLQHWNFMITHWEYPILWTIAQLEIGWLQFWILSEPYYFLFNWSIFRSRMF